MATDRWERVKRLFEAALECHPSERRAFLRGAFAFDPSIRKDIESLIASHDEAGTFLEEPPVEDLAGAGAARPGHTTTVAHPVNGAPESAEEGSIGPYRLLREMGQGGMGVVYEAEQEKPVRRKVALKLIKLGMDTKEVIARFEVERQALALMNHPNIAKVFDAGASERGRPFFAMEFVHGVPITDYCDKHRLSIRDRLELFIQVCGGIQHAHHKGIIHRDIKPSNVLVAIQDDKPVPKIIDFGVAKAISYRLTQKTVYTELGQVIGTPEYMSPEQAEMTGLDIDTRTDVYSLGVLLYELLVGAQPFDSKELRARGFDEIRRKIRDEEPPRPSTRLTTLGDASTLAAKNRRVEPPALEKQLRGDLDWITMRALEKDRTRRYASPHDLANDVGRHLRDEPVMAGPPRTAYRVGKFVRRHRLGVAGGAVVLMAILVGLTGTSIGLIRARRAEQKASAEAAKAEAINEFLQETLGSANPIEGRGRDVTVLEALETATAKIDAAFAEQPEVEAAVRHTIGLTYLRLGRYKDSERLLQSALRIQRGLAEHNPQELVEYQSTLAVVLHDLGNYDEAERLYREALQSAREFLSEEEATSVKNNLALLLYDRGDYEAAEPLYREVVASDRKSLGDEHPDLAVSLNNLANLLRDKGDYRAAEPLYREAAAILRQERHPHLAVLLGNLGTLLCGRADYEAAEQTFSEAVSVGAERLGENHPEVANIQRKFGMCLLKQGRNGRAEAQLLAAHRVLRATLGQHHERTAEAAKGLLDLYRSWGKPQKAAEYRALLAKAKEP
ncbi:MAG: tetratricopeptide repeat protein [Acidobacteriota bacterium]